MVDMDKLVSLCKRRGYIFQSSEIYGGMSACWDYGPLGVELKRNVKEAWWNANVRDRDDMVGLDCSILMHRAVWVASGHEEGFSDPLQECKACHQRWRGDDVTEGKCPDCGGELTEPRMFNLMFKTFAGPVEEDAATVYLRPETAQGIFVNFANVLDTTRKRLPFGIAQIGKAFRNEITTGNFIFRCREFEQMEIEYFVKPGSDDEWFKFWVEQRYNWYLNLGIKKENLKLREHSKDELAHYARACTDVEYLFPMGWSELEGIANRTDFDLKQHAEHSGRELNYFDPETSERYVPYVIEPSAGVDRAALAFLADAYDEETVKGETRVLLRLHRDIAPVKVAILPLSKNEKLVPKAREVHTAVRKSFPSMYDDTQSIGRRYRRQDEIGTPYTVTVDFDSMEDNAVTIRERDSMKQIRVPVAELAGTLQRKLDGEPMEVLPPGGRYWSGFEE
jgi:glycyl-tRNA synthetase